ncbi:MAG: carbamoyltransferase HypF [Desulfobulbaceae bacterium A2]|nr:MAG: carbamoyltransferase HypF [Desulfobulbaceae bacterium A2]
MATGQGEAVAGDIRLVRVTVGGTVQGVGFRPLVYRLATGLGLSGWVVNGGAGVEIELGGPSAAIDAFLRTLREQPPPLARIAAMDCRELALTACSPGFAIRESTAMGETPGPLPADSDLCPACLAELFDPHDRRHLYPFIVCTDCGARYTVIEDIPFDRERTAMQPFPLCARCTAEYADPGDRRFHAQTTCCPDCGPHYRLLNHDGIETAGQDQQAIAAAAALLASGRIVAIKGVGGFHLAVDGADEAAVQRLRRRKYRPDKPLALMVRDLAAARRLTRTDAAAEAQLLSHRRPIVLLPRQAGAVLAPAVAPEGPLVGIMLPYTPAHYLLFRHFPGDSLVMTSGNMAGSPIIRDNQLALARLGPVADAFLLHDRGILVACDDSVQRGDGPRPVLLRRSRGYVPEPLALARDAGRVLACGAMLKNTFCLTRGREAFVSHHIGDLDSEEGLAHLEEGLTHMLRALRLSPTLVACDLHPDYPSSRLARREAERRGCPLVRVQHHHAHAVSCMAEHGLDGPVLALTLDGVGLGDDNTVWGGELLLARLDGYERLGHLWPVTQPGGDAVIREPWRMAFSWLDAVCGSEAEYLALPLVQRYGDRFAPLRQMAARGLNSPRSTSCGRLFDAVSALLGLCETASYEGQAAARVELVAERTETAAYPWAVQEQEGRSILDPRPLIAALVEDLTAGVPAGRVASRFHRGLAGLFAAGLTQARERTGLTQVVLSGGVCQNIFLLELLITTLETRGFTVFIQNRLPPGDGGLSLGQAVAAAAMMEKKNVLAG